MRLLNWVSARFMFAVQFALLLSIPCFARDRGPRVDIVFPSAPIPLSIDKDRVLVYELHITNFDTVPFSLKHVDVFASDESNIPLINLEGDKLATATIRIGIIKLAIRMGMA